MRNLARINISSRCIPVVTLAMISLLILCFFVQFKVGAADSRPDSLAKVALLFSISSKTLRSDHSPRLLTANLFHVNPGHLLSNVVGLLFLSSLLEIILGKSRVTIVILLSALGGTIGSLLFHMVDWMVGSSTVLFGVLGGLGVLILKYRRELHRHFISAVIGWCITLIFSSTLGYISLEKVDQGAHVGGLAAGILSTLLMIYPYSLMDLNRPLSWKGKVFLVVLFTVFGLSFIKEVVLLFSLLA